MMSLIVRFYDPSDGQILLGGRDTRELNVADVRHHIAYVLQDPFLFNATVRENIASGQPYADAHEIETAAQMANAHEFVARLPQGYETFVGERGTRLSAGQRQRIAIARAMLRNPAIVIWDEATAALDAESEAAVREGMRRLLSGRISFTITHELRTILDADKILVLSAGLMIGWGTHEELMSKCPLYKRLYELQFEAFRLTSFIEPEDPLQLQIAGEKHGNDRH